MLKRLIKTSLRQLGFEIRQIKHIRIPFGVDWCYDIRYLLKAKQLETVFDVGANVGSLVHRLTDYFPHSYIYAFEPVPSTFKKLVENTHSLSVKPVNAALGDKSGQALMTAATLSEKNTLLVDEKLNHSPKKQMSTAMVDIDTVDNYCKSNGINRVDLLKIDTEGFEINVLKGSESLLEEGKVDFILVECEFFRRFDSEPHGNFVEILNYLQKFQYRVVSFYTGGVDNFGWRWGDVLFRKVAAQKSGQVVCSYKPHSSE